MPLEPLGGPSGLTPEELLLANVLSGASKDPALASWRGVTIANRARSLLKYTSVGCFHAQVDSVSENTFELTVTRGRAKKVSLTVDEGVLSAMEREAKKAKRTLSAEVTEALARELLRRRLQEFVTSYEQEKDVITAKS